MSPPIYMDSHSTTPVDPRVLEEMLPYFGARFGNASSLDHSYGHEASEAVEVARGRVAGLVGARPEEIVFTGGATESNNIVPVEGTAVVACQVIETINELLKSVCMDLPIPDFGSIIVVKHLNDKILN